MAVSGSSRATGRVRAAKVSAVCGSTAISAKTASASTPSGPTSSTVNAARPTITSAVGSVSDHMRGSAVTGIEKFSGRKTPGPTQKFTKHMTTPASSSQGSASASRPVTPAAASRQDAATASQP